MATLSAAELNRVRYELGDNVLAIGAEPYIWHVRLYDLVQQNVASDATAATTSTTAVTAAGPASLTLASAAGVAQYTRLVLDADEQLEVVTVRSVLGAVVSVVCQKTHGGTYNVEIESPLTMVRAKVAECVRLGRLVDDAVDTGGVKKVDEVEFFGDGSFTNSRLGHLQERQRRARVELASMVGLSDLLRDELRGGASRVVQY